jgi:hypothetical protein
MLIILQETAHWGIHTQCYFPSNAPMYVPGDNASKHITLYVHVDTLAALSCDSVTRFPIPDNPMHPGLIQGHS